MAHLAESLAMGLMVAFCALWHSSVFVLEPRLWQQNLTLLFMICEE